jgi:tetratricopeptide (TPR) repeat protein
MSPFFVSAQGTPPAVMETMADTLVARQNYQGGLDLYNKILKQSKKQDEAYYTVLYKRAFAYFGLGKLDEALADVNQCIERYPSPQASLLRLSIYEQQQNYEAQLKDLNDLIVANPDPYMMRWRTSVLFQLQRYKEAQRDIQFLLTGGEDAELRTYLGVTYYYLNRTDSAMLQFDKVIANEPTLIDTYVTAGSMLLEDSKYEAALKYINLGLKQEPANATLLFYKGAALIETKDIDKACSCLRKAFDLGMDDPADYLKEYCFGGEQD